MTVFIILVIFIVAIAISAIVGLFRKKEVKTIFEERREKLYNITGTTKPMEESWSIFKPESNQSK